MSDRIDAVRGYSKEERKEVLKQIEASIAEHEEMTEIRRYIQKKYPNPENLSFKECLKQALKGDSPVEDEDSGYILDIRY
ncbi:MAG: hypothetical protein MJ188_00540 [Treponema sp.]|nr:hypothetical protein [Treponema sp.]